MKETISNTKLLSDKPASSKEVTFDHKRVTKKLAEIIKSSPRPFTIGLFGRWGTGKSTVARLLGNELDKRKYAVVVFDVWKYESDALRRSFLIDTVSQLKSRHPFRKHLNGNYEKELAERLYTSTTHSGQKFSLKWRAVSVIVVFLIVALLAYIFRDIPWVATASAVLGIGTLISLDKLLDPSLFVQNLSIGVDRVNSPEVFAKEFNNILEKAKKTVVVVVDNLDRTEKDRTLEVLRTIKTFLNNDDSNQNVIFIIASDDVAIKAHIKAVYSHSSSGDSDAFDANEFLKKFFNVTIDLPAFIDTEMIDYIKNLLDSTNVEGLVDNSTLQEMINWAYKNPREIKQYINSLAAYMISLRTDIHNSGLTKKHLSENIIFIAKLLIFRDRFHDSYLYIYRKSIEQAAPWSQTIKDIVSASDVPKELKNFHELTEWVSPTSEDISWIFNMRRSKEEISLPGWELFISASLRREKDSYIKLFNNFDNLQSLNRRLKSYEESIFRDSARYNSFFVSLLDCLSNSTVNDIPQKLLSAISFLISKTPKPENLSKIIDEQLPFEYIAKSILPTLEKNDKKPFINNVVGVVTGSVGSEISKELKFSVIENIAKFPEHFGHHYKKITDSLNKEKMPLETLRTLSINKEFREAMSKSKIIEHFLETNSAEGSQAEQIEIIKWLSGFDFSATQIGRFLAYVTKQAAHIADENERNEFLDKVKEIMDGNNFNDGTYQTEANQLGSVLDSWFRHNAGGLHRSKVLNLMAHVADLDDPTKNIYISHVRDFLQTADAVGILNLETIEQQYLDNTIKTRLQQATVRLPEVWEYTKHYFSDEEQGNVIADVFNNAASTRNQTLIKNALTLAEHEKSIVKNNPTVKASYFNLIKIMAEFMQNEALEQARKRTYGLTKEQKQEIKEIADPPEEESAT